MNEDEIMAKAVKVAETSEEGASAERRKKREENKKSQKGGIITFIIGAVVLVAGLVLMLVNLFAEPGLRDAEYLVEIGAWAREDEPSVIWKFTEVGKGTLTTNEHLNDYEFIWAIDGDKIEIETDWLYTLNDDYEYELNQNDKKLTLKTADKTITFVALESE